METVTLHAPAIHCNHCVMAVSRGVGQLAGVTSVGGDPRSKNIQVMFDPKQVSLERIKQAMAEAGYPPE